MTFGIQSIIANRTNLQSPCFLVSYAALKLFLKSIWRCTWTTSMMNPKSSLINRIVVTLVTLIWLFIRSVTANMTNESLSRFISLFVVTLSLISFVNKLFCDSSSFQQKWTCSYIGGICKKNFCESSSFLQKCIRSHIGCICKKPPNVNGQ